jgi:phosphomannomutase
VKIAAQETVDYIKQSKEDRKGIIIGYDTRFMSEKFASTSAKVLAGDGIFVYLCERDVSTPVITFEILQRNLRGGINFTASHNPPEYNGLKFTSADGGPTLPSTNDWITKRAKILSINDIKEVKSLNCQIIKKIDPFKSYIERLKEIVDLEAIRRADLDIVLDFYVGNQ